VPFTLAEYLVIAVPPSKVETPHETVILVFSSVVAVRREGAPGTELGVCIAEAVLAVDSVVASSVTVTTLNSSGVLELDVGATGSVNAARVTTGAEITAADDQLGEVTGSIRMLAMRITGTAE
jgi:hypothetical protein